MPDLPGAKTATATKRLLAPSAWEMGVGSSAGRLQNSMCFRQHGVARNLLVRPTPA